MRARWRSRRERLRPAQWRSSSTSTIGPAAPRPAASTSSIADRRARNRSASGSSTGRPPQAGHEPLEAREQHEQRGQRRRRSRRRSAPRASSAAGGRGPAPRAGRAGPARCRRRRTAPPRPSAWQCRANSEARRVLPAPASPPISTTLPPPARTSAHLGSSSAHSCVRPTNRNVERHRERGRQLDGACPARPRARSPVPTPTSKTSTVVGEALHARGPRGRSERRPGRRPASGPPGSPGSARRRRRPRGGRRPRRAGPKQSPSSQLTSPAAMPTRIWRSAAAPRRRAGWLTTALHRDRRHTASDAASNVAMIPSPAAFTTRPVVGGDHLGECALVARGRAGRRRSRRGARGPAVEPDHVGEHDGCGRGATLGHAGSRAMVRSDYRDGPTSWAGETDLGQILVMTAASPVLMIGRRSGGSVWPLPDRAPPVDKEAAPCRCT